MELGLSIELRATDKIAPRLATIAAMGYQGVHAHFPEGCDKRLARTLASACAANGLSLFAVSGYANPLRPAEAPMGMTVAALQRLIELLPLCGARAVVSWSGTRSAELFAGHPENTTAAAWAMLSEHIETLLPLLDAAEGVLLLKAQRSHVLADVAQITRFFTQFSSPYLGLAFDGTQFSSDAAAIGQLAPFIRLLYLRTSAMSSADMERAALVEAEISAPIVLEDVSIQQARGARFAVLANASVRG
jgi:sugar phosphate isomerase/epimerase